VVFNVPRAGEKPGTVKPFDISVSSLDCLVELCPEGKVRVEKPGPESATYLTRRRQSLHWP